MLIPAKQEIIEFECEWMIKESSVSSEPKK